MGTIMDQKLCIIMNRNKYLAHTSFIHSFIKNHFKRLNRKEMHDRYVTDTTIE